MCFLASMSALCVRVCVRAACDMDDHVCSACRSSVLQQEGERSTLLSMQVMTHHALLYMPRLPSLQLSPHRELQPNAATRARRMRI